MSKVQRSRPGATSPLARTPLAATIEAPVFGSSPAKTQTPLLTDSVSDRLTESISSPPDKQPRYLQLLRKEARLRVDQADALAALRRRLMRERTNRSAEILTDNTLIRVAVDLLLDRVEELHGGTEDELRASLGLPPSPA